MMMQSTTVQSEPELLRWFRDDAPCTVHDRHRLNSKFE